MLHADQDLDQLTGMPAPRAGHLARGGRQPRSDRGATAVRRSPAARTPVGQRREGVGLAPAARRGRARSRRIPARSRGQRLRRHRVARGRPAQAPGRPGGPSVVARRHARAGRVAARRRASYPAGVRRATAITLVILFVLLVVAAAAQFRQPTPTAPFPGPSNGTELPSPTRLRSGRRGHGGAEGCRGCVGAADEKQED